MREILYRAWDKRFESGCMLKVNSINYSILGISYISVWNEELNCCETLIQNYELMQYTGLKERNGNKIFEGDIYKWYQPLVEKGKQVYIEHFEKVIFEIYELFFLKNRLENGRGIEVIGNIYENPELLKE